MDNKRMLKKFIRQIEKCYENIISEMKRDLHGNRSLIEDNFHLIKRSYVEAVHDLRYIKNLSMASDGTPILYEYIYNFCKHGNAEINKEIVDSFLTDLGSRNSFTFSDAAACISLLKLCCIESIEKAILTSSNSHRSSDFIKEIGILRLARTARFDGITEKLCKTERALLKDDVYSSMDNRSKAEYRYLIEQKAIAQDVSEYEIIKKAQELTADYTVGPKSHFGYWLYDKKHYLYVELCVVIPVIIAILLGAFTLNLIIPLVSLLPLYFITKNLLDVIYSYKKKASYLPRIKLKENTPKTLVCYVTMLDDISAIDNIMTNIEKISITNSNKGFMFGFLADFKSSSKEVTDEDGRLLDYVAEKISLLEKKYGNIFFGAVRKRSYNSATATYGGKERKRGAVCDFISSIVEGNYNEFVYLYGDVTNAVYLTVLDSDTQPTLKSIEKLVGVLEHPLSAPVLDESGAIVSSGYGIAVPKMELKASSWSCNFFTQLFGGIGGGEAYCNSSFSVYSDLYGDGIFCGKGVIRINLFYKLLCDRLPDNLVLSHDIVEGGYLRTAYVSDVTFFDTMPTNLFSYLKRSHRWIRGDVQNLYFLRRNITSKIKYKNPLTLLTKFKLSDNVLRAIYPIGVTLCIMLSAFYPICSTIGIISVFMPFAVLILQTMARSANIRFILRGFDVVPALFRSFLVCLCELALLPTFAYNAADAMIRSSYRVLKRDSARLMEWVTAADADKQKIRLKRLLSFILPQTVATALMLSTDAYVISTLWFIGLGIPYFLSFNKKNTGEISTDVVMQYIRDMWGYYTDFLNEDNNYLPPDNFQEEPLCVAVTRTSPTNIGLVALSVFCGYAVGMISAEDMYSLLGKMISSIEQLPKFKGNLFNWYDIKTLKTLSPAFISFVDSGNLAVCLETLKAGLLTVDDVASNRIAGRIDRLLKSMDLGFMFDKNIGLFHIGYDVEMNRFTDGHYDLYASESMLSSYYCICKGIVPSTHWEKLGRAVCESFGKLYVKSWSGTMFEYYLPFIFLPAYKGTFNSQMLKSVISAQKQRNRVLPWGNSESGYYLFDDNLYYQYKAFGVQKLAFKRPMNLDNVISPYSSFLTLNFNPESSLKNLKRLEKYSMRGKYGFYEALDATPSRVGKDPVCVKMYMSHHISMSFLAAVNYIKNNLLVELFFSGENAFYTELLEERVRDSAIVMQNVTANYGKETLRDKTEEYVTLSPGDPVWTAISDRETNIVLSDIGCGYSENDRVRLTKYRKDMGFAFNNCKGVFAAVKNEDCTLCATYAPVFDNDATYKTSMNLSSVTYSAKKRSLNTAYTVTVIPNSNCELRKLTVKNESYKHADCDIAFYFESVLTESKNEEAHPAFSNLFVSGSFDGAINVLSLVRRKRNPDERTKSISVTMFDNDMEEQLYEYELTRFNVLKNKDGMRSFINAFDIPMMDVSSNTTIPVDPCVCLRTHVSLKPFESTALFLIISSGDSVKESVENILHLKKQTILNAVNNINKLTVARFASMSLDREGIKIADLILRHIMNGKNDSSRFAFGAPSKYPEIYKYGLCGDLPIIFASIGSASCERLLPFIRAFTTLNYRGIDTELLIGYTEEDGYTMPVYNAIKELLMGQGLTSLIDRRGGIFIRKIQGNGDFSLLMGICSFYVDVEHGVKSETKRENSRVFTVLQGRPIRIRYYYKTGVGGYAFAGKKMGFGIDDGNKFPYMPPWCHVMANPRFGTLVSNMSLGFTFGESSSTYKITPFTNDIIRDNDGEKLLLKIGDNVYDILKGASAFYEKGLACFETEIVGMRVRVTVFICVSLPVKAVRVEFENLSEKSASIVYKCDVSFGLKDKKRISTSYEADTILFTDPYSEDRSNHCVLLYSENSILNNSESIIECKSGESVKVDYFLGYVKSERQKNNLLALFKKDLFFDRELKSAEKYWNTAGTVNINTLDPCLDLLFNGFLQYQVKCARLYGKLGFYQCSGAFGFRDQLQDTMALALTQPKLLKKQILLCCSKQFFEGDVLHWWFKESVDGSTWGSRTRSSDDLLWLPLAVCEFVERVGSEQILYKPVPYIMGRVLSDDENEAYIEATLSDKSDTVYLHCKKAIIKAIKTGKHGLLLFGSGDWNDSMNNVGAKGSGESVWGSFFAVYVLEKFAGIANQYGDQKFSAYCMDTAMALRDNIELNSWDGQWYRRGYYDNGDPLGAYVSDECKIDLLPQAFAAICGGFDPGRVRGALDSVDKLLVDRTNKLVKIFAPPFDRGKNDPGYVKKYVPGVRENGGQYTHAAAWYTLALLKDGQYEKAYEILSILNPINRSKSLEDTQKYRVEPYVLAGDIYSVEGHVGMGGWTHYTGAAGWYFRVILEEVFGIKIRGNRMSITPALPKDWREFRLEMNVEGANLKILVRKARERKITVDKVETDRILLDGEDHEIVYQYLPV